ncbi:extensin-like domain-containing protein [Sphingomonas sp. DT-204]|uniref:extensin-like domain-containing protein n=1 Tax=Sphingomonas sp. DT-204 TaxID=3396166 RepID=UPI003F1D382B
MNKFRKPLWKLWWTVKNASVLLVLVFALYALMRARPQDLPWTKLDLAETPGIFTGDKLAALGDDFAECRALLDKAGVRFTPLAPIADGECGYSDGVRPDGGSQQIAFSPERLGVSCPVAAGLAMFEWNVLQPAAQRRFQSRVVRIEHLGSYNCRRMYGRSTGDWSEHARANALDVAGFVLADGTRVSVLKDWAGGGEKSRFLHEVRDGACELFATVLSPDYNAAHRDHLHLDQARRGAMGRRACR